MGGEDCAIENAMESIPRIEKNDLVGSDSLKNLKLKMIPAGSVVEKKILLGDLLEICRWGKAECPGMHWVRSLGRVSKGGIGD